VQPLASPSRSGSPVWFDAGSLVHWRAIARLLHHHLRCGHFPVLLPRTVFHHAGYHLRGLRSRWSKPAIRKALPKSRATDAAPGFLMPALLAAKKLPRVLRDVGEGKSAATLSKK